MNGEKKTNNVGSWFFGAIVIIFFGVALFKLIERVT